MPERWFRIREVGSGTITDPTRPDHVDELGLSYSGNAAHPEGAPKWIVRVYGTTAELDDLEGRPGVQRLPEIPTTALNQLFGQQRDAAGWTEGFDVTR